MSKQWWFAVRDDLTLESALLLAAAHLEDRPKFAYSTDDYHVAITHGTDERGNPQTVVRFTPA